MENELNRLKFLDQVLLRAPVYSPADYRPEILEEKMRDPAFRNALFLASPEFYGELEKQDFCYRLLDERKRHSLQKYFNRMCFRPTPFGAFATFSLLPWAEDQPLRLAETKDCRLHLRPSREQQLLQAAQADATCLPLRLNPLLYRHGQGYRYVYTQKGPGKSSFVLNGLPGEELNQFLVAQTEKQGLTRPELVPLITGFAGCDRLEAETYLEFLLREQVLLADLAPGLIEVPVTQMGALSEEPDLWRRWKQSPFGEGSLLALAVRAAAGPKVPVAAASTGFYAALERPVLTGGAAKEDQRLLLQGLHALKKLSLPGPGGALREFMLEFKTRFDRERVPLLFALDPDTGISYGKSLQDGGSSALLDELAFPAEAIQAPALDWSPAHRLFLKIWLRNSRRGSYEPLVLTDTDLDFLEPKGKPAPLPPSFSLLYRRSSGKIWIESAGGVSASALSGRFSLFSREVEGFCREISREEARVNPGIEFAEILQESDPHTDNVNRRCRIYEQVIPLAGTVPKPPFPLLPPADLWLSLQGEELVLESESRQTRIIPRLPTADNYHLTELPIFRFLCDLQAQGLQQDLSLDLERLLPGLGFYPRVEYGQVILTPAKWNFAASEVAALMSRPFSLGKLHDFCRKNRIPALISQGNGDQQLVFNLNNDQEALFFLSNLKKGHRLLLQEYFPPDEGLLIGRKAFNGQYLASIINQQQVYPAPDSMPQPIHTKQRVYPLGSDWLFLKIYCTPQSSDQLLREVIGPLMANRPEGIFSWFFIRYAEGGYHLRLRLQGNPGCLAQFLPVLQKAFKTGKPGSIVRDFQGDSYKRELERYREETIELSERSFAAGSEWVIYALREMIRDFPGLEPEKAIIPLVWLMAGRFLADRDKERSFYQDLSSAFMADFGNDKKLRVNLDQKFRQLRPELERLLAEPFLADFSVNAPTRQLLRSLEALSRASQDWGNLPRQELLADLVHMQVNRLFRHSQRRYEAVLYYCLAKFAGFKNAKGSNRLTIN